MAYAISFIQYISLLVVCFLGIIFGFILALIAPEELWPGQKYLDKLLKFLVFLVVILFVISSVKTYFTLAFLFVVVVLATVLGRRYLQYIYPLLSIILLVASKSQTLLVIEASLIFLTGLVMSSLYMVGFENSEKIVGSKANILCKLILRNALFFVVGLLFYTFG